MPPFKHIAPQSVQAVKGFTPGQLAAAAQANGDRFVHAGLGSCADRQAVFAELARAFGFADWFGGNLDALYDGLTDLHGARRGKGYVVMLDRIPVLSDLDAEAREALLDVFRDAAEAHAAAGMPFRVFYSFNA